MSEETKASMSLKKIGENNNMFGKTHKEETKELIRQKALARTNTQKILNY